MNTNNLKDLLTKESKMNQDNENGVAIEETTTTMQQLDEFVEMNVDELLSRCVIAFNEGNMDNYTKYRSELLGRVQKANEAKHLLKSILL